MQGGPFFQTRNTIVSCFGVKVRPEKATIIDICCVEKDRCYKEESRVSAGSLLTLCKFYSVDSVT